MSKIKTNKKLKVKNNAKTSKKVKTNTKGKKNKFNLDKRTIIIIGIIVGLILLCYLSFGLALTAILVIGILLIIGISKLLSKLRKRPKLRRILNIFLILFLILAIVVAILAAGFIVTVIKEAPEFDISKLTKNEASIFYDKDGNEIGRVGSEMRENVTYDDLPEVFIDALIATEDSRYFQHNGFDAIRFVKASIGQLLGNSSAGGASTLSMQVITNTYTDPNRKYTSGIKGIMRKFTDIYLAVFKLEKNYTKEEIIEFYVNNWDLSSNSYGVEQASQTYFNKSVKDLNLSEAALLAGIFNNPTAYNPYNHPKAAYERRATVLSLMVKHGYITQEEADMANAIPITSLLSKANTSGDYGNYIDTVCDELEEKYGINPKTTSVLVYTNMDAEKQAGIDAIMNGEGNYTWIDDVVTSGVTVIENDTGKIVAIGAGHNRVRGGWNVATQERRQIGSTAKPIFDYGPAIEYLNWSTYEQIVDEPYSYSNGQSIQNSDGNYLGQISMRTALAQSRNIPALKAFRAVEDTVGNAKIAEFATSMGIKVETDSNGEIYESHALGAFSGATSLEMAAAYATFANGGTYIEPTTISKIVYRDTNEVIEVTQEKTKVMSEATAYMITDMLVSAVNEGISSGAKISGVTVAAKTGTTNFDEEKKKTLSSDATNDSWIVGYDPEYTIAMWYGYQVPTKQYHNHQNQAAYQRGVLFRALGNVVFTKNNQQFEVPSSVVKVCVENGTNPPTLPSENTPSDQIVCEYFKKGTEPTETSTKYTKLDTVKNLSVSYDEDEQLITISWSKLNTPTGNDSYGEFGYNVYYGDVLLGFTTENTYTIEANTNISGTYKVVTTFENYTDNQSDPATYVFNYQEEDTYTLSLVGNSTVSITSTSTYQDQNPPVKLLKNSTEISDDMTITTSIKDPNGNSITSIDGSKTPLTVGTYTITYTVVYNGTTYTQTRKVVVTN